MRQPFKERFKGKMGSINKIGDIGDTKNQEPVGMHNKPPVPISIPKKNYNYPSAPPGIQ